jgi:ATP-dependent protease Clp, ATPase subunit
MSINCTFCGKYPRDVHVLIKGNTIAGRGPRAGAICNECVERCMLILLQRKYDTVPT